eukprot:CAMPEP_0172378052 /NCGR_PEP_ID=MMETSP1060-20121228/69226_1 /TAXON_ID=37318 /ORGANISM="Pseudo-nitzschia pungens, Strain cf. cingulata" /LENGTH=57 /DNA_ID=CAMNT_0013105765 /DNA_START=27 /DNA_END=200 /DNA_ORIENTATION=-
MFLKILQGIATWLLPDNHLKEKVKELQKALEKKEANNNLEVKVEELQKAREKKESEL